MRRRPSIGIEGTWGSAPPREGRFPLLTGEGEVYLLNLLGE